MHPSVYPLCSSFPNSLFFFWREWSATREINGKSSFAQSGFLSHYLQPSKPPVLLCFRGLSRAVPNSPAHLSRILKLSLCVRQKTFHKSNKDEGQSRRLPTGPEHGNAALIGPLFQKHSCKVFQDGPFSQEQRDLHVRALNIDLQ